MVFSSVSVYRASTLTEILQLTEKLAKTEKESRKEALNLIKDSKLKRYIDNTFIIENLFTYGRTSFGLRFPGEGDEFFSSAKEARELIGQLSETYWKELVKVDIEWYDDSMIEMTISII